MLNFAREVYSSIASPVWDWVPRARLAEEAVSHG